ncbi:unnamed protein product, partial [Ectocarpus fasciculatus]
MEPSARCCDKQEQQHPAAAAAVAPQEASEESGGVLLYYKYIPLGEEGRVVVKDWYVEHCRAEGLRGRVRVALDGVNCTLGGSLAALRRHIGSVEAHAILRGQGIDFKLASSRGARNSQAAQESGFTTLSVKAVKEVVTLGARGAGLSHLEGGRHVSPQEFHRLLQEEAARKQQAHEVVRGKEGGRVSSGRESVAAAGGGDGGSGSGGGGVVDSSSPDAPTPAGDRGGDLAEAMPPRRSGHGTVVARAMKEGASAVSEGCAEAPSPATATSTAMVGKCGRGGGGNKGDEDVLGDGDSAGANAGDATVAEEKEAVLLDVRNVYETSIGRFSVEGIETLDPKTRQFSDLPKWVDENADRLRQGRGRVLMYCTGGVRCELASALVRRHCDADATGTDVLQLSGGIERYLQAYPHSTGDPGRAEEAAPPPTAAEEAAGEAAEEAAEAAATEEQRGVGGGGVQSAGGGGKQSREGFFCGKNFVFDERVSVPESPAGGVVMGRCVLCERPWDDYGSRCRCTRCRMLVLVCDACISSALGVREGGAGGPEGGEGFPTPVPLVPLQEPRGDDSAGGGTDGSASEAGAHPLSSPPPSPTT